MNPNQNHRIPIRRSVLLVLGLAGHGKTSLLKLLQQRLSRSIVIDDEEEFTDGVRIRAFEDLIYYLTENCDKPFRILYSSPEMLNEPYLPESEFNRFCEFIHNIPDFTLFINEVSHYSKPAAMPIKLKELIAQSRRQFIDIVATVRRKTETHNDMAGAATMLASFKQLLPDDIHFVRSYIGETADQIPQLAELEFIYYTGKEIGRDKIDFQDPSKIVFLKKIDLNGGFSVD